ncbi:MAG: TRAP transporter large permease [Alphaproteobacteria bacterium]|nr:TRAP transporter large permease [Alphaproteobacteria bacterium]
MTWELDLILVFGAFIGLMMGGMWVPYSIAVTALAYLFAVQGLPGLRAIGLVGWGSTNGFTLTAIPMFILMAEILLKSGLSQRVYRGLSQLVRRLPGGLLQTNVAGCAMFAAISGSSVATAAAVGTTALPLLHKRGYDRKLAAGTLAAGGTLGILIPPSIAMIIYGTFTDTSIAKLFMAGIVPGLLLTAFFMLYVAAAALIKPSVAPRQKDWDKPTHWPTLTADLLPFAALMFSVLGSLYFGFATPTEAAGVGSLMALIISRVWGGLTFADFRVALKSTVRITGGIMFIVLAAFLFSYAVGMAGLANNLTKWLTGLGLGKFEFMLAVIIGYIIMGCLVDSIGMMVITIPLLYPILLAYGFDMVWFGVLLVVLIELGQITPPLGINLFVIQSISVSGTLEDVLAGSLPFVVIIIGMILLLWAVPELATWLPANMTLR